MCFLEGNPIVGYSKLKNCGGCCSEWPSFAKEAGEGRAFQAAEARYMDADQVDAEKLGRWLGEARDVQWDYRNLRRKGRLERSK